VEKGMPAREAALLGAREIAFTVMSMSVSLVAVFLPLLLMGGMLGRLFREFAVTLSTAILVSLIVSLTTTPAMCATLLKPRRATKPEGRVGRESKRVFGLALRGYERSLAWALRHPWLMLALTLGTIVLNVVLFAYVPKGFFPQQDTGRLNGSIQADQDISFQAMRRKLAEVNEVVASDPAVEGVMAFVGGAGGSAKNTGRMFVMLKPLEVRRLSADQVIARLRGRLAQVPGAPTYLQAVQDLRIGGTATAAQYQYALTSEDLPSLTSFGSRLEARLRTVPGLLDVNSDQQTKGLETSLVIDRATASRLGIATELIDDTLYDAFGQRQVSLIYTPLNQYHVVMEAAPQFLEHPVSLRDIQLVAPSGAVVPLDTVVRDAPSGTTLAINHRGQTPAVNLSFNLAPGLALGDAVKAIESEARSLGPPAGVRGTFSGAAQAFKESLRNEPMLVMAALLAVYVVLGLLYESYVHPITILSTLPSAGVGALLALLLTRTDLSVMALIGIILLIGLVKKNGIMMVDFALDAERREKKTPAQSIYQACVLRFRPIMMTTMAALLGALPLALGRGMGSELRRPLGIAIVGGLIVSQLLTLYTTPVIYLELDRVRLWVQGRRRRPVP
jgi:multidrug efflux pump